MRAFLAVNPDPNLRERIVAFQQHVRALAGEPSGVRVAWTPPAAIHLTIRFFADLDDGLAAPLRSSIDAEARRSTRMSIPLARLGAFPRPPAPRVLWLGPPEGWDQQLDGQAVEEFVREINLVCARLGLPQDDTPWRPHLTLARIKAGERALGRRLLGSGLFEAPALSQALPVNSITLVRSTPTAGGHTHTPVWTVPIA